MTSVPYNVPKWAGKPSPGLHLDVLKESKLIQKLMIDEKKCYLFGRNVSVCDVCIEHSSCSRVHAALVWHKNLERAFLVDLGSAHGTYIGSVQIESNSPTQLPIDSTFHFGASTRFYTLREKPLASGPQATGDLGDLLNLPEDETALDSLTEYNTANNKRITMLGIPEESQNTRKRKSKNISFKEEEDIINPEDIDPSVGRFRNLVQTTVVSTKRAKFAETRNSEKAFNIFRPSASTDLKSGKGASYNPLLSNSLSIKLGIQLPNPAPETEQEEEIGPQAPPSLYDEEELKNAEKKKKYEKEAWPGKKPGVV
ncbi:Nuclear inhibitor of protein phosphatase 1 [Halotydeus destructor]|nr:Nuclear inhibitor of protein phosphatase 1 [Halotydeus destructor]